MAKSKLVPGPIGIFDSGFGGLSIFKEIEQELPQYDYIYLGDNARAPYGTRSFSTIYKYTWQAVQYLLDQGCNLIILACNTASAKALRNIQQINLKIEHPEKRVLGVLRPTTEIIGKYSQTNEIGILATPGTVRSNSYPIEINNFFPEINVHQQACPMWVPLIENFEFDNEGGDYFIKKYVEELMHQHQDIDTILLACTHYPLIMDKIKHILSEKIQVISQGHIVAKSLANYLERHQLLEQACLKNGQQIFLTSGAINELTENAANFLGRSMIMDQIVLD